MWVKTNAQIEAVLRDRPQVQRACQQVVDAVRLEAQAIALGEAYDTGQYVSSMATVRERGRWRARARARHAAPLEGGTGIYGPKRKKIRAQPGKRFVFKTRLPPPLAPGRVNAAGLGGVERTLALTEHRGMPGRHIMQKAARSVAGVSPRLRFRMKRWAIAE